MCVCVMVVEGGWTQRVKVHGMWGMVVMELCEVKIGGGLIVRR